MKNSRKQYPPQTGKYIVKVKNGRGWDAFSTARFHISVGQEYHEGDKFKATVEWAKHRFDKVIICVNDTLQRHNYMYRESLCGIAAYNKAEAAGREWIERNYQYIQTLPDYEITRWDEWRSNSAYDEQYEKIISLYNSRHDFRELINIEIMEFWKRRRLKEGAESLFNFDGFKKASTEYLLEETAVFFMMFKKDRAVDVYPGSTLLPCVFAEKITESEPSKNLGERAFTRIDFSRNEVAKENLSA